MFKAISSHPQGHKWNKLNKPLKENAYRGRFAPSPSGNLHLGSLLAALASYLQARSQDGTWLLRIEDLDPPRSIPGADLAIIKELARFGMVSDEPVLYQSHEKQQTAYAIALEQLIDQGLCYPCLCNRKTLSQHPVYPQTCRQLTFPCSAPHAIKLKTNEQNFEFNDAIQGHQQQNIQSQCGDFNIRRKDGLICYQLAVVIDDAKQGITEVVRGIDILDSTARQMHIQSQLGYQTPEYAHIPVLIQPNGDKLSKQNHAKEIYGEDCYTLTHMALQMLGQNPPKLGVKNQAKMMRWAIEHWDISLVPKQATLLP